MLQSLLEQHKQVTSNGCWEWTGTLDNHGYGVIYLDGKMQKIHKLSFQLTYGKDAFPLVRHKCHNKKCFNPDHLAEGTHSDNFADGPLSWGGKVNSEKTHCPQGHEYSGYNLILDGAGRKCRTCQLKHARDSKARKAMRYLLLLLLLLPSCTKIYNEGGPTSPDRIVTPKPDLIEFRVSGTATQVTIRYTSSIDGLNQTVSGLPWSTTFSSTRDILFVSLDATAQNFSSATVFLSVQIFINGVMFREASANGFTPQVVVSGTHRR